VAKKQQCENMKGKVEAFASARRNTNETKEGERNSKFCKPRIFLKIAKGHELPKTE
jgi:hypothetical protein